MIIDPITLNGKYIRIDNPEPSTEAHSILYVKQAGFFTPENCPPMVTHKSDCLLLIVDIKGKGTVRYEGQIHKISTGQCVFLDCSNNNNFEPDSKDPWEAIWMTVGGAATKFYYDRFTDKKCCVFVPKNIDTLITLLNKVIETNLDKTEHFEIVNAKLVTDVMTNLITDYTIITDERQSTFIQKLYGIKDYLDSHFTGQITLDALSEKFFISKFYLSREFKKEFGVTVVQYVLNKRIEKAKYYLANSSRTIEEISALCGFNDQSYFSRQFKNVTGSTCLSYRKSVSKPVGGEAQ